MRYCIIIALLLIVHNMVAQQEDVRQYITSLLEDYAIENDTEVGEDDDIIDRLMDIYNSPIDLNLATREQLEALPFLSDFQIENLLAHIYSNGPILQVFELAAVQGFSMEDISRLLPFITIETIPIKTYKSNILRGAALMRLSTSIPRQEGYKPKNDSTDAPFKGYPYKFLQKSEVRVGKKWHAGYLLESDAGEPMFSDGVKAFDFMSAFITYTPDKSIIKKVLIGDYSARFGQGLGMWTGFSMGMTSENTSLRHRATGLTRYHSAGESAFLRGAGIELRKDRHSLTIYGSYKPLDATTTESDSLLDREISVLRSTGLHRTDNELKGRHAIDETIVGGYYEYGANSFKAGIGAANWQISAPLTQSKDLYRRFYFTGSSMTSISADYRLFLKGLQIYGEAAVQQYENPAFMQALDFKPGGAVEVTLAYRYFDRAYTPLFQNPYSRSAAAGGESGFYGAVSFQPAGRISVTSAINYYIYSWLRYRTSIPSSGFDYNLWMRWRASYNDKILVRYRHAANQQDKSEPITQAREVAQLRRNNVNLQWQHKASEYIDFQTIISYTSYSEDYGSFSEGYWISQDVRATIPKLNLSIQGRIAHFDTDDFNSRIYVYEPDVLYSFSVPARSGNGVLGLLNMSYKVAKGWQIWCRVANVYRRDTESVGTSYTKVNSPNTTEFKLQLRYQF